MGKTGGGVGTNQYQMRGVARAMDIAPLFGTAVAAPTVSPVPAVPAYQDPEVMAFWRGVEGTSDSVWSADTVRRILQKPDRPPRLWRAVIQRAPGAATLVVRHPSCPPDLLWELSQHTSDAVRTAIAENPECPAALWDQWANSLDDQQRKTVASLPNCPTPILATLATQDFSESVRVMALSNPSCPIKALKRGISGTPMESIAVARNLALPPEVAELLLPNSRVHNVLYNNPAVSSIHIAALARRNPDIHENLLRKTRPADVLLAIIQTSTRPKIQATALDRPTVDGACLRAAADSNSSVVRAKVAGHKLTPPDVLDKLSKSKTESIQYQVAGNASTPVDALVHLITHPASAAVRHRALERKEVPDHIRAMIALGGN